MNRFIAYIESSYEELVNKVTWPSWKELSESAVVVSVASLIIALMILAMDQVSRLVLRDIIYNTILG